MVIKFGDLFLEKISRKKLKNSDQVVFIGMQDVDENATIKNFNVVDYENVKNGFTYFERNDVLLAKITPCFENGKGGFADKISELVGFGSTEFHILRAVEHADARYVYYQTKRPRFRLLLEGEMVGSAGHRRVPFSAIQQYELEFRHSKEEQSAIANALSDVDALIAALEKLINKKSAVKTAAMQQLLTGKKRLPPFDQLNAGYKQTELGEIPGDWEATTLGEIADVRMCKRVLVEQTEKTGSIPFFKIGTFGAKPDAYIPENLYREFKEKYSFPERGDILISAAGTLGKVVVYDGSPAYFQDSNIVWLEVNKQKIHNEFLYHYYKIIVWASSEGSTILRLYNGIIRATTIALPPLAEQTAIANVLSDMDKYLEALKQRLHKTQEIKQGMMQELLTGRTRLI